MYRNFGLEIKSFVEKHEMRRKGLKKGSNVTTKVYTENGGNKRTLFCFGLKGFEYLKNSRFLTIINN